MSAFSDTNELAPGGATVTRSFDGFQEAAEEAGASRVYGGIHWQFDNQAGLIAGRQVGQFVSDRLLRPHGLRNAAVHAPPFHDSDGGDRGPVASVDDPDHRDDADDLRSLLTTHEPLTS